MQMTFRSLIAFSCLLAAPALAADLTLDQAVLSRGDKAQVTFKSIVLTDCNLTEAEAKALFSGALSRDDSAALLEKLTAKSLVIGEVESIGEDGARLAAHEVAAENIVKGAADSISLAGIDATAPDDSGDSTLHSGRARIEHVALPGLAAALRSGDVSVAGMRFSHAQLGAVDVSVVDKGTPAGADGGNRIKLHVEDASVGQTYDSVGAPLTSSMTLTGASLKLPPESKGFKALAAVGYADLSGEAQYSGTYDAAAKTYRMDTYALDVKNVGRISFSGQASGVEIAALTGSRDERAAAYKAASIDWAQIDVANAGLFEKIVALNALSQGKTAEGMRAEWRAIVAQAPLLFSGAPAINVTAQAVARFITDPRTLTLKITGRDGPMKIADFANIDNPMDLIAKLNVTAPQPARPAGKM